MIADFLHIHKIDYEYDTLLSLGNEKRKFRPDFFLTGKGIIIEYWGMEGDDDYDARTRSKKKSYMEIGQSFVSIRREDIRNIDYVLKTKLTRLGVVFEK